MRLSLIFSAIALMLVAAASEPAAQSLAEVARAEEARRKSVKAPTKVYTNDDLKGGTTSSSTPAPPQSPAAAAPKPDAADATAKPETQKPADPPEPKKDEKYWRDRMTVLRQSLARNKVLLDALQSRVNALNTDFTNMDDPAQRALIEENRKTTLAEMDRVAKDTEKINKALYDLAEEARKANVPPGYLR